MVLEKECLQRPADLCSLTEEQRVASPCLYSSMPGNLCYDKSLRIKALSKQMFSWQGEEIFKGVNIYHKKKPESPPSVLVLIPKKSVNSAVSRNLLRRRTKEVFRKSVNREKPMNYLIKFNGFVVGFERRLELFLKNV